MITDRECYKGNGENNPFQFNSSVNERVSTTHDEIF